MEKEELRALVDKALAENPDVFPGSPQIAELLSKKYGIKVGRLAVYNNFELSDIQLKWINSCSEKVFFENMSRGTFSKLDEKFKEAEKDRFRKIVDKTLDENPDVFPGSPQIAELLSKKYGVKVDSMTVYNNLELSDIQLKWINSCSEKVFLENMSRGTFSKLDEKFKEAEKDRFRKIVDKTLDENPDVFPSSTQIPELLRRKYGVNISESTILNNLEISNIQLEWINSCSEKVFFENMSRGTFRKLDEKCKEAERNRFRKIVDKTLDENPDVFPGSPQIAELLSKKYGVNISERAILNNLELSDIQLEWINSCSEKVFFENMSRGTFSKLDEKCKEAVNKRMYQILLSHINDLESLQLSKSTLDNYLEKFPDLRFLKASEEEHRFTVDQRIVLRMQVWRKTRSEELHKLIGERLEQLWGFRELFALMKDGRCLNAAVVSMFHEDMPEKIKNYIPQAEIEHFFIDDLVDGKFKAKGDVLLLSFMHWLTEKQAAEILLRLNRAVGTDNTIFMTSPNGLEYSDEMIEILNSFGFNPEKIGELYLLPPDSDVEPQEQRKLLTKSRLLQFRKINEVEKVPEEARLFNEVKKNGSGERIEPKSDIINYNKETLQNAKPYLSMREVRAIFVEEVPEVKEILLGLDIEGALIELKGGTVIGFNMSIEHPYSIEIEGKRIPRGIDNAIIDIFNGKQGFNLKEEMKERYNEFLNLIRKKRESISTVKKTLLKK